MLRLHNIGVSLGGKEILKNVSFFCNNVGCTAIMGASGIGKTTLLRVIAGLITADEGEVESTFQRISMKFQEPRLFPWLTVRENVAVVLPDTEDKLAVADGWLAKVGLSEAVDKYPAELSGGMAQRTALARALAYDGDLLLLDEPFSAVDEATKEPLLQLLREYAQNHAVLLVTHNAEEARLLNAEIFQI
ncbi:MAG: ABC transporter ATP-binding protein [Ruminococcaceae bacterium]|nr:ABC transporter ATP-binding protein [Oscillospiraceae bacterium]